MQLFSAKATVFEKEISIVFSFEKLKKQLSKLAHNLLIDFFQYWPGHFQQKKKFKGLNMSPLHILLGLIPRTTDIQRELFFKNSKLLGLGRQIGLKILRHLRYFRPNYQHYFGNVSPLSMGKYRWFFFIQKTLVFRSKTFNSQMLPK